MKLIAPRTTKSSEIDYFRKLMPIVSLINSEFNAIVMPVVSQKSVQKQIVDASALDKITQAFKDFNAEINRRITNENILKIGSDVVIKSVRTNKAIWKTKTKTLGIDIRGKETFYGEQDYIKSRIKTNTSLIKNLSSQYVEELGIDLFNAYEQGKSSKSLAKDVQERYGITARRAKLIARNEVKNTNSQMNLKQAAELGFDEGVWMTVIDGRERELHKQHDNKKFKIGVGLSDGNGGKEEPGDAINCRCTFFIDV